MIRRVDHREKHDNGLAAIDHLAHASFEPLPNFDFPCFLAVNAGNGARRCRSRSLSNPSPEASSAGRGASVLPAFRRLPSCVTDGAACAPAVATGFVSVPSLVVSATSEVGNALSSTRKLPDFGFPYVSNTSTAWLPAFDPRAQQEEIDLMPQRGCNQQIRLCWVIRDGLHRDKFWFTFRVLRLKILGVSYDDRVDRFGQPDRGRDSGRHPESDHFFIER